MLPQITQIITDFNSIICDRRGDLWHPILKGTIFINKKNSGHARYFPINNFLPAVA
jgi:hypothetical protein